MSVSLPEGTWCDSRWSFPLPRFAFWTLLYRRARLSFRNSSLSHHSLPRADDIHVDSSRAPVEIFSLCWNPIFVTHSKPNGNIIGYYWIISDYILYAYIYRILSIGLLDLYRGKIHSKPWCTPKKPGVSCAFSLGTAWPCWCRISHAWAWETWKRSSHPPKNGVFLCREFPSIESFPMDGKLTFSHPIFWYWTPPETMGFTMLFRGDLQIGTIGMASCTPSTQGIQEWMTVQ